MTPFDTDQRQLEPQDEAALERYAEGSTDAAFAQPPQFADADYLAGYVATIQRLPQDSSGRILYTTPAQQFAFGWVDSPDPYCGEF